MNYGGKLLLVLRVRLGVWASGESGPEVVV
jgi:hypothetical protein